jgi:hypothetical protein
MPDVDSPTLDSTEPTKKPQPGLGLVGVALILPVLSGVLLCFAPTFAFAIGISAANVISTAALVAIDAKRLGRIDLKGRQRESAGLLFVGMCLMWIVVYPVAFFRRSAFASPNLGFVSLFVALFFAAKGLFQVRLSEPELPLCTTRHVKRILEQVIRSTLVGATVKSIDGHREVGYNRGATVRRGECVAHTDSGDIPIRFIVEWQDREKGLLRVRIPDSPD